MRETLLDSLSPSLGDRLDQQQKQTSTITQLTKCRGIKTAEISKLSESAGGCRRQIKTRGCTKETTEELFHNLDVRCHRRTLSRTDRSGRVGDSYYGASIQYGY